MRLGSLVVHLLIVCSSSALEAASSARESIPILPPNPPPARGTFSSAILAFVLSLHVGRPDWNGSQPTSKATRPLVSLRSLSRFLRFPAMTAARGLGFLTVGFVIGIISAITVA